MQGEEEKEVGLFSKEQKEKAESETFIWRVIDAQGEGKNGEPLSRQDRQWEVEKSN